MRDLAVSGTGPASVLASLKPSLILGQGYESDKLERPKKDSKYFHRKPPSGGGSLSLGSAIRFRTIELRDDGRTDLGDGLLPRG